MPTPTDPSALRAPSHWEAEQLARERLLPALERNDVDALRRAIVDGAAIDGIHPPGTTPLALSIKLGHAGCTATLVRAGAVPCADDLGAAIGSGEAGLVRPLLASPRGRALLSARNVSQRTPLHVAALDQQAELVTLLLEAGADPWAIDRYGDTPAMTSLRFRKDGDAALVATIATFAAHPAGRASLGHFNAMTYKSALHRAAELNCLPVIELLVGCGIGVNALSDATSGGHTAFQAACIAGTVESAQLLVSLGADARRESDGGKSALHLALIAGTGRPGRPVEQCRAEMAAALVGMGCDPLATDSAGHSARALALAGAMPLVLQVIDAHSARQAMARTIDATRGLLT